MGLVICDDCGQEVSDAAPACIHCGRPMAAAAEARRPGPLDTQPRRVITSEDSFATRSRGCADLLIWGGLAAVLLAVLFLLSRGC